MMKSFKTLFLASAFLISGLYGQTSGKIKGVVTDADGQPLVGVNILIGGTDLGAATDENGEYFVINVRAGIYSVTAQYIGYASETREDVRITVDRSIDVNFTLQTEAVTGEEVTVVAEAERETVPLDVSSSSVAVFFDEAVAPAPIRDLDAVLGLQPGVISHTDFRLNQQGSYTQSESRKFSIRGGGDDQISLMVDGITMVDERMGRVFTDMPLSAFATADVVTGGFNAEYGNVRAGLFNLVSKEPSKLTGSFEYKYGAPHYKYFNDDETYWSNDWRIYAGPTSMDSTAEFEGWNIYATSVNNADDDASNDISPEGMQRRWEWEHRPIAYGAEGNPDYTGEVSLGGPVPGLSGTKFMFAARSSFETSVMPMTFVDGYDGKDINSLFLKLTQSFSPNLKLDVIYMTSNTDWLISGGINWGNMLSSNSGRAFLSTGMTPSDHRNKYGMEMLPYESNMTSLALKATYTLSKKTFATAQVESFGIDYDAHRPQRDTSCQFEYEPGKCLDGQPWGNAEVGHIYFAGDGYYQDHGAPRAQDTTRFSSNRMRFNITSQVNNTHMIKAGFSIDQSNLIENMRYKTNHNQHDNWNKWDESPTRIAFYVQDRIEWEGMIANFGVRVDQYDAGAEVFAGDTYSPYFSALKIDSIGFVPTEKSTPSVVVSPRFGISHPIGPKSKIFFNYGHYYSSPTQDQWFGQRIGLPGNKMLVWTGNPNLKPAQSISYELGYDQDLYNQFLLHFVGYYRDITAQTGQESYTGRYGDVGYTTFGNNNYQDIYGIETRIEKKYGKFFYGYLTYDWVQTTSGYVGSRNFFEDPRIETETQGAVQFTPVAQPNIRANIEFHTPQDYGTQIAGLYPLGGWTFNLIYFWREGARTTYLPPHPDITNNVQWVDFSNTDLRISKSLNLGGIRPQFYLEIRNLLNQKYLSRGGFMRDEWDEYMKSLKFPHLEGEMKGNDKIGEWEKDHIQIQTGWKANRWALFLHPRSVQMGFKVSF